MRDRVWRNERSRVLSLRRCVITVLFHEQTDGTWLVTDESQPLPVPMPTLESCFALYQVPDDEPLVDFNVLTNDQPSYLARFVQPLQMRKEST